MSNGGNHLEVWLDSDLCPQQLLGWLSHDRGVVRFLYDRQWLNNPLAFAIDPELNLGEGAFFPKAEVGNFGTFLDSSPDRWGQTLMRRREALQAKDEGRKANILHAWDFLLGVQDITRQGALRFKQEGAAEFLANEAFAAPPVTNLIELAEIAREITRKDLDNLDQLRRWLAVLVAPGASLGGARPKANFTDKDGSLWIAKFPAYHDDIDIGAWEGIIYQLAGMAKVDMSPAKVVRLNTSGQHTFCAKRFDSENGARRFYASAMTLLGKQDNAEGTSSYLEIAEFIANQGDPAFIDADLEQLFRRVVFNIAVGNRDDHLRNHGFILNKNGWRLSPAFDINPNIHKAEHVLNIDTIDNRPSLDTAISTAAYYRITDAKAQSIASEIVDLVGQWRQLAKGAGISKGEMLMMEEAFITS